MLPVPAQSSLGAQASVRELLEEQGVGPDGLIFLPHPFVERAPCPVCQGTAEVNVPVHRWIRDPSCAACGGQWRRLSAESAGQDVLTELSRNHPRSNESLSTLGFLPGDIVELHGGRTGAVQLIRDASALWREV